MNTVKPKVALDSSTLNDNCNKMSSHMPNMKEILKQISTKIQDYKSTKQTIMDIEDWPRVHIR